MPRFLLKKMNLVEGKQAFFKLYKDEKCEFDAFCSEIEQKGRYLSELKTALHIWKWLPISKCCQKKRCVI